MPLSFFQSLSAELALLGPRYGTRRLEHPALHPYPSIASILLETRTRKNGKQRYVTPEGAAILCALTDLHRRTRDRLWGAILVRAFLPMIRKVEKRLIGGPRDERRALLLSSLNEALLRVDPSRDPLRIAMYVRQETRRSVFLELRKELEWKEIGFGADPELCADPATQDPPLLRGVWARGRGLSSRTTHALICTIGDRGGLWQLVRSHYASLPRKEQAQVYRRLQARRHRYMGRLRAQLKGEVETLAEVPVTTDPHSHGVVAVTRDRHGRGDAAVTRDTFERASCDRHVPEPCDVSVRGAERVALEAVESTREVAS